MAQHRSFMKNLAIMGGMLMVWAFGPGRLALDATSERSQLALDRRPA